MRNKTCLILKIRNLKLMEIQNYFKHNQTLSSGAQPTIEQINELKRQGFEAIVNISTPSAKNAIAEEAIYVEKNGMDYVHFPVDCSNLKPTHYQIFKGIIKGFENKKTFVHCGANIKSSNLIHMYQVLEMGKSEEESLKELLPDYTTDNEAEAIRIYKKYNKIEPLLLHWKMTDEQVISLLDKIETK